MCTELTPWEKAVEFHGHTCPGLAMGYRASMEAMERLKKQRSQDEEIVALVETDACGVDAVQVITGCTFGKGNLFFRDLGKQVFTFGVRGNNQGIRAALKFGAVEKLAPGGWQELREKVFRGEASDQEKEQFNEHHQLITERLLEAPLEEVMDISRVSLELPSKARIYNTVQCGFCGEGVMEPRARVKNGRFACLACTKDDPTG